MPSSIMLLMRAPFATSSRPLVGRWMPAIILRNVLLPDPLRPTRPTRSPSAIESDTDCSAQNSSTLAPRPAREQAEQRGP